MSKVKKIKKINKVNKVGRVNTIVSDSIKVLSPRLNWKFVEHTDPKNAALALELLAQGDRYDEVKEKTGIGFTALAGLRVRHQGALDERRASLAQDGFQMAEQLRMLVQRRAEMLADNDDELRKVNIKDLVLSNAIAQDKAFNALGENKVVIEHRKEKLSIEDARRMIQEAREELAKGEINVSAVILEVDDEGSFNKEILNKGSGAVEAMDV